MDQKKKFKVSMTPVFHETKLYREIKIRLWELKTFFDEGDRIDLINKILQESVENTSFLNSQDELKASKDNSSLSREFDLVTIALRDVFLSECQNYQYSPLTIKSKNLEHITYIVDNWVLDNYIFSWSKITDVELKKLPDSIKALDLSYCENITNESIKLFKSCKYSILNLSGCNNINDDGLLYLNLCEIRELMLIDCKNITKKGINTLNMIDILHIDRKFQSDSFDIKAEIHFSVRLFF